MEDPATVASAHSQYMADPEDLLTLRIEVATPPPPWDVVTVEKLRKRTDEAFEHIVRKVNR